MLQPSHYLGLCTLVKRAYGQQAHVSVDPDLGVLERRVAQSCFEITADELPIVHVRWGPFSLRASGRMMFSASRVSWWNRGHRAHSLGWCENTLLGSAFGSIGAR